MRSMADWISGKRLSSSIDGGDLSSRCTSRKLVKMVNALR